MKLYHYAPKDNTIMTDGLLAIIHSPQKLLRYAPRAHSSNPKEIIDWLDHTFSGRSRSISVLTEPIDYEGHDVVLKKIVDKSILYSFELNDLIKDGMVETIWCKNGSLAGGFQENFYQVLPQEIDISPLAWHKCDSSKDLLYAVIRHYLIVPKDGIIPPKYITLEK